MIIDHGPSIVFLPSPRHNRTVQTAAGAIGLLAKDLGLSSKKVRDQARGVVESELER